MIITHFLRKNIRVGIQVFQHPVQCFFSLLAPFININSSKKSIAQTNFPWPMSAVARYPFYYLLSKMISFLSSSLEYIVATIKDELCFYQPVFFWHQWLIVFFHLLSFFILVNKGLTNCWAKNKTLQIYLSMKQPNKFRDWKDEHISLFSFIARKCSLSGVDFLWHLFSSWIDWQAY